MTIVLSKNVLGGFYRTMLKIRMCEEALVKPIQNGFVKCPVHLYTGQEAVAAGICASLNEHDHVFGTHRSHGHYLAMGGNINTLIAEIYGKDSGCSRGRGGSMHVYAIEKGFSGSAPIVGGTISLAVGAALAVKIRKQNQVSVSFFGDGATGEGVLFESLNFTALYKLPVMFVCENNLYSTHLPIDQCRPKDTIHTAAEPFGIPHYQIDGNNVIEVYETAQQAVAHCRAHQGPVFIECLTYRMRGHVGPDDNIQGTHTDIRPKEEIEDWKTKNPIDRLETYLLKNKIFVPAYLDTVKSEIEKEIDTAFRFAEDCPYPDKSTMEHYVFRS